MSNIGIPPTPFPAEAAASRPPGANPAAIEEQLALYRSVAERMPIGIALTNSVGEIIFGNEALTKMVRHPIHYSSDTHSYGEWEAYHADGRRVASHEYRIARILREGVGRTELDVHYVRGDNTRFWMRIIGDPITDD